MLKVWLTLVVVFGSLYPAAAQTVSGNIRGKVVPLSTAPPRVRLAQTGSGATVEATRDRLMWDFNPTETGIDQGLPPGSPEVVLTPTPGDAQAWTYRLFVMSSTSPTLLPSIYRLTGVACTVSGCVTPPFAEMFPRMVDGGSFEIGLSREYLPRFHESAWSPTLAFTVLNGGGPPPPPPPPPPPAGATTSPDCTLATSIVDASERTWTLVNRETRRDGIWVGTGQGQTYLWANQTVYVFGVNGFWYRWAKNTRGVEEWQQVGGAKPACAVAPPPPPPPPPPPAGETLKQQIQKALDQLQTDLDTARVLVGTLP